jgi:hypothetical protein
MKSIRDEILRRLAERGEGKTICPSEVLPHELKKDKEKMESVRAVARELVAEGLIEITQGGQVVDPQNFRGPVRLRLK